MFVSVCMFVCALKEVLLLLSEEQEEYTPVDLKNEIVVEKEMATHSSILAWKSPWTEEPGWLQSMGLHD